MSRQRSPAHQEVAASADGHRLDPAGCRLAAHRSSLSADVGIAYNAGRFFLHLAPQAQGAVIASRHPFRASHVPAARDSMQS